MIDEATAEHWHRHRRRLALYRYALDTTIRVLHGGGNFGDLRRALEAEPVSTDLTPAVDAARVDLAKLLQHVEAFSAAYRALPAPHKSNSYTKYLRLPEPYPKLQRGMLDQCFRVLHARRHDPDTTTLAHLDALICGVTAPPGMEGFVERYAHLFSGDVTHLPSAHQQREDYTPPGGI
jgi:hypothetical protein